VVELGGELRIILLEISSGADVGSAVLLAILGIEV
jgi:hypothetical protein